MNALENERETLIEQIEQAFPDRLSGKERMKFLRELTLAKSLALDYEIEELEAMFRNRVWQVVAFDGRSQLYELEDFAALTDEGFAYYLPAFLVASVNDPLWLINHDDLEQRLIGCFSGCTADQREVMISFIDMMLRFYSWLLDEQDTQEGGHSLLDIEDIEYRLLMYQEEKRALLNRRTEA